MADDVELPELPPKYKWQKGSDTYPTDWDVLDAEKHNLCYWVEEDGSISRSTRFHIMKTPSQQDAMHILAARLWMGMEDFDE